MELLFICKRLGKYWKDEDGWETSVKLSSRTTSNTLVGIIIISIIIIIIIIVILFCLYKLVQEKDGMGQLLYSYMLNMQLQRTVTWL